MGDQIGYFIGLVLGKVLFFFLLCMLIGGVVRLFRQPDKRKTFRQAVLAPSAVIPALLLVILSGLSEWAKEGNARQEAEYAGFQSGCVKKAQERLAPEDAEYFCACVLEQLYSKYSSTRELKTDIKAGSERFIQRTRESAMHCTAR